MRSCVQVSYGREPVNRMMVMILIIIKMIMLRVCADFDALIFINQGRNLHESMQRVYLPTIMYNTQCCMLITSYYRENERKSI